MQYANVPTLTAALDKAIKTTAVGVEPDIVMFPVIMSIMCHGDTFHALANHLCRGAASQYYYYNARYLPNYTRHDCGTSDLDKFVWVYRSGVRISNF